jgi:Lhr-like helicase
LRFQSSWKVYSAWRRVLTKTSTSLWRRTTLDLGIDWGDVDLVINIGAPKGASRIMQRIGRANHRHCGLDLPALRRVEGAVVERDRQSVVVEVPEFLEGT